MAKKPRPAQPELPFPLPVQQSPRSPWLTLNTVASHNTAPAVNGVADASISDVAVSAPSTPPAEIPDVAAITEVVELQEVRDGELSPPLRNHERADRRETTAYGQYREMYAATWRYIMGSAAMAVALFVTTSGAVTVTHWSFFGLELTIDSRVSIVAILIMITVALALMVIVNATRARALFTRCGLFYQQSIYPRDSRVLRWSAQAAIAVALALQVTVWSSVVIASIDLAFPHRWTIWYEKDLPSPALRK